MALQCGEFCKEENNCDKTKMKDCLGGFIKWAVGDLFGCPEEEDVLKCLLRPVRDIFKAFLRHLLAIFDAVASGLPE